MVSRRSMPNGNRRAVRRTGRPAQKAGAEGDQRRLAQLLVSLTLFLLVYAGRGVFPAQAKVWHNLLNANVDFSVVFQEFSQAISDGSPVKDSLEALCVRMLGGEPEHAEHVQIDIVPPAVVPLGQLPGAGLSYLEHNGMLSGVKQQRNADELIPEADVEPRENPSSTETEPELVTAMAQEYADNGVKLPRNVSFAFYELGLPETIAPVNGPITSTFGYRDSPINGKNEFHLALDIGAEEGTEIGAFADGIVRYIGESDEFGQYLKIDHANNVSSFYAHCSRLLVHKGDTVSCGQTVALVGHTGNATGSHLHLTIEKDNIRLDPAYYVDPA